MVKNLPLLILMFITGCIISLITSHVEMIPALEWTLRGVGFIITIWSIIALLLHLRIYNNPKK
ncbi:TPA: hypothetical protein QCR36_005037 [Bacillus cereus]|nr:hypothetical protein [Bacillus cereus]HDR4743793.1 hypothetical protein [Bacillus cereus]HDR4749638.1 hypothetical protein [Bacillus cereus]HDR4754950.1 hypothetical protein [Bacillus cereus]HDR4771925.1 hypothetical protein [Bacillus cereus]